MLILCQGTRLFGPQIVLFPVGRYRRTRNSPAQRQPVRRHHSSKKTASGRVGNQPLIPRRHLAEAGGSCSPPLDISANSIEETLPIWGQIFMWHTLLLPLAVGAVVELHFLLVRAYGVVPLLDAAHTDSHLQQSTQTSLSAVLEQKRNCHG